MNATFFIFLKTLKVNNLKVRFFVLVLGIFFFISPAICQVVNIESKRFNHPDSAGFTGLTSFNMNYTQNTQTIWQIGNETKLLWTMPNKNSIFVLADLHFIQANSTDLINNGFGHFRFNKNLLWEGKLKFETFQQVQYNSIQLIKFRSLTGAGVRQTFFDKENTEVYSGIALMNEVEIPNTTENENWDARLSSYLSLNVRISKSVSLNTIAYYQPLINQFKDYRFMSELRTTMEFTKTWSYKIELNYLMDKFPPLGAPNEIYTIRNALVFRF